MSVTINGKFHLGESWIINGVARDPNGKILDLTNAQVNLRIVSRNPNVVQLDLATPGDGQIATPGTLGQYQFIIPPAEQASMTYNSYDYEVRITLGNGELSVQNTGEIVVLPSLFVNFP
jgi:hypothetical protein